MKILITGNMGYVGSALIKNLRHNMPNSKLIGFDMAYFKNCLTNTNVFPESRMDYQYYGDIRKIDRKLLHDVDAIINLAAISNDPMGNEFSSITSDVNFSSAIKLANLAKRNNVKTFIFASSCSIYGNGTTKSRTEEDQINPLTEYAKSKVNTEKGIRELADDNFKVTSLRFSTACGMSDRLRLDLVLNDFVASAIANNKIQILSDGSPWRPLIHVEDMARAFHWALIREREQGGNYLEINVGKNENNYQIKDLAYAVKDLIPNTGIEINTDAIPDKRSYKVSFNLFNSLAPNHLPIRSLESTILGLHKSLNKMGFSDKNFRNSELIRLQKLTNLRKEKQLNEKLEWIN